MIREIRRFIEGNRLLKEGDVLLVAVSGGIDSMVMAHALHKAGFGFSIAHCNFQLRGSESGGDEKFVREYGESLGCRVHLKRFDTQAYAREKKVSVQMAARKLRYDWFEELAGEYGYSRIATAHQADDAVETFFINLLRGTGLGGLTGINVQWGKVIRPLLFASRAEIIAYAKSHRIAYREDRSNAETKYLRNKIRHDVLPLLGRIEPAFAPVMQDNIARLNSQHMLYKDMLEEKIKSLTRKTRDGIRIDTALLAGEKHKEQLLYEILGGYGFSFPVVRDMLRYMDGMPGKTYLSSAHTVVRDRNALILSTRKGSDDARYYLPSGHAEIFSPLHLCIEIMPREDIEISTDPRTACIDRDMVEFPLTIRKWKQGDRFYPLGMDHSRKLSDFFTDLKLSLPEKENVWLLCSGNDIVWIIGYRIDHRYRVTSATRQVLRITWDQ